MIESKLKFLTNEDYWVGRNEHYGILCTAHFDKKNKLCGFNTNISAESKTFKTNLIKHLEDGDYKRLVIFTRTSKEVGHPDDVPSIDFINILEKECRESVSNSPGPGCIVFDFNMPSSAGGNKMFLQTHAHLPSVGDMFIFPAGLPHWVYPFTKTEGERVSISGNIKFNDSQKKQV